MGGSFFGGFGEGGELEGLNSDGLLESEACGGVILVVGVGEID